jgi:signal peptidase I
MENEKKNIDTLPTHEPDSTTPKEIPVEKKRGTIAETIRFALISLLIVVPFRIFVAQPFIVEGASMNPTFIDGEYLIVDQISYRVREPKRGEIVIFKYPRDLSKYFIKRIIGLPNETIEVTDGHIFITGATSTERTELTEPYIDIDESPDEVKIKLKSTEYFVLGDNREASSDSRVWGPLQRGLIIGTPILRLYPLSTISVRPGHVEE